MADQNTNETTKVYNLKEAAAALNLSPSVVRKAAADFETREQLREFKPDLPQIGIKCTRNEKGNLQFSQAAVDAFKTRERKSGGYKGQGKAWKLWLTGEQLASIKNMYPDVKVEDPYAYNRKYQKEQRDAKAAKAVHVD